MFEVFYNSVENSTKTYMTDRELLEGLEQDFECACPKSYEIVYRVLAENIDGAEYCDNNITVIYHKRKHKFDIGDLVKINYDNVANNGMEDTFEQAEILARIAKNPDKIYKIVGYKDKYCAPYVLNGGLENSSFYADELIKVTDLWECQLTISEPNVNGDYGYSGDYVYKFYSDKEITHEQIKDCLFEALEIEQIYSGEIMVEKVISHNDSYVDCDNFVLHLDIQLKDNVLSNYVDWTKCKGLPCRYAIDRAKSKISVDF